MRTTRTCALLALLVLSSLSSADQIKNWAAPSSWTPASGKDTSRSALVGFPPLPFIALTPCRLVDTRGNGAPLTGGFLPSGTVRSYTLTGICNVPASALAVSLNATVVKPAGPGFLVLYPAGGTFPPVSTLNYLGGDVIVNAAVVPLSSSGGISMALGVSGGDVILDVNGFYGPTPADPSQVFTLTTNSNSPTMTLTNLSSTCAPNTTCGLLVAVNSGQAIGGGTNSVNASDAAVVGVGVAAIGVQGQSTSNVGVLGTTSSSANDKAAVFGRDGAGAGTITGSFSAGVRGEGKNGVIGFTNTLNGVGVFGQAFSPGWYGVFGSTNSSSGAGVGGEATSPATWGVYAFGNLGATGTKPFVEPHPFDASKEIRYVAVEGPEAGTYFRGSAQTLHREAVIDVPETFRIVTAEEGLTVHLTPVGELAQIAVISRDLNQIVVRSSRDVTFDYLVHGVRRAFKDWQVIADGVDFRPSSPEQKMPSYLPEEAKRRLIANGTYNADGTVNMSTAERLGWAKAWREEAAAARAATTRQ